MFAVRWCSLDWLADLPYGRTMSSNGDSAARALARLRKAGFVAAVVYGGFAIANEVAQRLVARGIIEWHDLYGYVSDLCVVPALSGLMTVMIDRPSRAWLAWLYPACAGALYTALEFEGTWDPWDLVAYGVGAVGSRCSRRARGRRTKAPLGRSNDAGRAAKNRRLIHGYFGGGNRGWTMVKRTKNYLFARKT